MAAAWITLTGRTMCLVILTVGAGSVRAEVSDRDTVAVSDEGSETRPAPLADPPSEAGGIPGAEEAPESGQADGFWTADKLTGDWGGLRRDLADGGLDISLSYQQHYMRNFRGGEETHNADALTGTYDWVFQLDLNKLGVVPANEFDYAAGFYLKAKGTYNDSIQGEVGSLFDPNADPAGEDEAIYIKKWWLWQTWFGERLELRLGVIESVKDLFDVSLYANHEDKDFLNRASYRNVTIPHATGMGAFLRVRPLEAWYLQAAAIDAQSREFHTQFDTAFHDEDWYLGFWETGLTPAWSSDKGPMPGRYRLGFWYNPRPKAVYERRREDEPRRFETGDVGFYLGLDQMVWKENSDPADRQGLGLFGRYGSSHGDVNRVNCYWQAGASYKGLLPTRERDVTGFSVAQGRISESYRQNVDVRADAETVYEWYYAWYLTPAIIVSPDLQVIQNPGGRKDAPDAIVGGLRLRIIF